MNETKGFIHALYFMLVSAFTLLFSSFLLCFCVYIALIQNSRGGWEFGAHRSASELGRTVLIQNRGAQSCLRVGPHSFDSEIGSHSLPSELGFTVLTEGGR